MSTDRSFDPVYATDARVLILGSLPGKRSIQEQGYYAHPRNLFWSIMAELIGVPVSAEYQLRLAGLINKQIALWDVAAEAVRPGSLDSAIRHPTVIFNPIPELLDTCPRLDTILFNGAASEQMFHRAEKVWTQKIECRRLRLPSTSPANAGISVDQKRRAWLDALNDALGF